ncbi:hypothetical protein ACSNOK_34490, partial [Streptomyces sp. URMC 126]
MRDVLLSELLPAGVVCAEAFEDTGEEELFPEERALVAAAATALAPGASPGCGRICRSSPSGWPRRRHSR